MLTGLKLHGMLEIFQSYPDEAKKAFLWHQEVSAEQVLQFYKPSYSEATEQKMLEGKVMYHFNRLMKKAESNLISNMFLSIALHFLSHYIFVAEHELKTSDGLILLEDILMAFVGMRCIPRTRTGIIIFNHLDDKLSSVNTCAPSITFSRIRDLAASREKVEEHIVNIVKGAGGTFGIR